jgi:hypothetical protein
MSASNSGGESDLSDEVSSTPGGAVTERLWDVVV